MVVLCVCSGSDGQELKTTVKTKKNHQKPQQTTTNHCKNQEKPEKTQFSEIISENGGFSGFSWFLQWFVVVCCGFWWFFLVFEVVSKIVFFSGFCLFFTVFFCVLL